MATPQLRIAADLQGVPHISEEAQQCLSERGWIPDELERQTTEEIYRIAEQMRQRRPRLPVGVLRTDCVEVPDINTHVERRKSTIAQRI